MSPYLLLFNTVTTGQNGAQLGSDEKPIVLLAYGIVDVAKNEMVTVQCYVVRPEESGEDSELSEFCRLEFGLTDSKIQQGIPLHVAIEKFDKFVREQLASGYDSMQLVADGQLHVRQCLQPQAYHVGCELPEYYWRFHDLRKHFCRQYDLKASEISGIQDMLDNLCLDSGPKFDPASSKVMDMFKITQRMTHDGCKFSEPEEVFNRLDSGICSREDKVESGCVVRARGLPWQSSDQDIANFFRGLNIAKGGVALCLSPQGRRNGEALVRFISEEHRDMALRRHRHHIGNRYIEIYRASGDDFVSIAGGGNTEAQEFLKMGGNVIVRMRGLPYDCTAKQVLEFFNSNDSGGGGNSREGGISEDEIVGDVLTADDVESRGGVVCHERGVLFVKKPDGRSTGDAFVQFASEEDASRALAKHRHVIGARYIELFRSTVAEVQQVLNRSMDLRSFDSHVQLAGRLPNVTTPTIPQLALLPAPHVPAPQPSPFHPHPHLPHHQQQQLQAHLHAHLQQAQVIAGTRRDCVRLRGLPFEAQVEHILQFLGELANLIKVQGVHMVINGQGQPSGEAFIQMVSEEAAYLVAKERDHRYMPFGKKQRYIEVFQCSGDEMNVVLNGGTASPNVMTPAVAAAMAAQTGLILPTAGTFPSASITRTLAPLPTSLTNLSAGGLIGSHSLYPRTLTPVPMPAVPGGLITGLPGATATSGAFSQCYAQPVPVPAVPLLPGTGAAVPMVPSPGAAAMAAAALQQQLLKRQQLLMMRGLAPAMVALDGALDPAMVPAASSAPVPSSLSASPSPAVAASSCRSGSVSPVVPVVVASTPAGHTQFAGTLTSASPLAIAAAAVKRNWHQAFGHVATTNPFFPSTGSFQ